MANVSCAVTAGSSPRVRGKLRYRHYPLLVARIIPAHAGQTCCRRRPSRSRPDHPRACGANPLSRTLIFSSVGSSPRMRGKLAFAVCGAGTVRIIPAHAGQTDSRPHRYDGSADHPRACGANTPDWVAGPFWSGSSPRMRGKRFRQLEARRRPRIIPAHAGQTEARTRAQVRLPDHPRACGANTPVSVHFDGKNGSSPRMRGKLGFASTRRYCRRIIPAHAGQTSLG